MRISSAKETLEIAYTINKMTPDSGLWDKPTHTIEMIKPAGVVYDQHIKSKRSEIVSTPVPQTRGKATFSGRTSTTHRVMDFMQAGQIIAAAEKISIGHTDWARFCYDPTACQLTILRDERTKLMEFRWQDKTYLPLARRLFCAWAWTNKRKVGPRRGPLFIRLAIACLAEERYKTITGRDLFSTSELCRWLGYKDADDANWHRGINPHYRQMSSYIAWLNSGVLTEVSYVAGGM